MLKFHLIYVFANYIFITPLYNSCFVYSIYIFMYYKAFFFFLNDAHFYSVKHQFQHNICSKKDADNYSVFYSSYNYLRLKIYFSILSNKNLYVFLLLIILYASSNDIICQSRIKFRSMQLSYSLRFALFSYMQIFYTYISSSVF